MLALTREAQNKLRGFQSSV